MIKLKPISIDNLDECIDLDVEDFQKRFVASNVYSIAESSLYPEWSPMAIYHDGEMVGFVMFGMNPDDNYPWIIRFMVDKAHQRKGFGRAAMLKTLEHMVAKYGNVPIRLSTSPTNTSVITFYESLGFKKTGDIVYEEALMERPAQ